MYKDPGRIDRTKDFLSKKVPGKAPRFDAPKLKIMLKLSINRLNLQMNKKMNLNKQEKHKVAQLLEAGKEDLARIRVENIIRDDLLMESFEILQIFAELVMARLSLVAASKKCPPDLVEAVSTLIWASLRAQIPELQEACEILSHRYGKDFYLSAIRNDSNEVNDRVLMKMSVDAPNQILVLSYMEEIAKAHHIDWSSDLPDDPADEEVCDSPEPTFPPVGSGFVPPGAGFVPPGAGGGLTLPPAPAAQVESRNAPKAAPYEYGSRTPSHVGGGFVPPGAGGPPKVNFPPGPSAPTESSFGLPDFPTIPTGFNDRDESENDGGPHKSDTPDFDELAARFDQLRKP